MNNVTNESNNSNQVNQQNMPNSNGDIANTMVQNGGTNNPNVLDNNNGNVQNNPNINNGNIQNNSNINNGNIQNNSNMNNGNFNNGNVAYNPNMNNGNFNNGNVAYNPNMNNANFNNNNFYANQNYKQGKKYTGKQVIALVLGILSWFVMPFCTLAAGVIASIGLKTGVEDVHDKSKRSGLSIATLIISFIGVAVFLIFLEAVLSKCYRDMEIEHLKAIVSIFLD